nr:MAG TPA: hypothetical protein [Bacteriophage sp.]
MCSGRFIRQGGIWRINRKSLNNSGPVRIDYTICP